MTALISLYAFPLITAVVGIALAIFCIRFLRRGLSQSIQQQNAPATVGFAFFLARTRIQLAFIVLLLVVLFGVLVLGSLNLIGNVCKEVSPGVFEWQGHAKFPAPGTLCTNNHK